MGKGSLIDGWLSASIPKLTRFEPVTLGFLPVYTHFCVQVRNERDLSHTVPMFLSTLLHSDECGQH